MRNLYSDLAVELAETRRLMRQFEQSLEDSEQLLREAEIFLTDTPARQADRGRAKFVAGRTSPPQPDGLCASRP